MTSINTHRFQMEAAKTSGLSVFTAARSQIKPWSVTADYDFVASATELIDAAEKQCAVARILDRPFEAQTGVFVGVLLIDVLTGTSVGITSSEGELAIPSSLDELAFVIHHKDMARKYDFRSQTFGVTYSVTTWVGAIRLLVRSEAVDVYGKMEDGEIIAFSVSLEVDGNLRIWSLSQDKNPIPVVERILRFVKSWNS
jgi:hypothetical protein